jgi:hypothetical protein
MQGPFLSQGGRLNSFLVKLFGGMVVMASRARLLILRRMRERTG